MTAPENPDQATSDRGADPPPRTVPTEIKPVTEPKRGLLRRALRSLVGPLIGAVLALAGRWVYDVRESKTAKQELLAAIEGELAEQVDRAYQSPQGQLAWRGDSVVWAYGAFLPPTPAWQVANGTGSLAQVSRRVVTVLEEAYDRLGVFRQFLAHATAADLQAAAEKESHPTSDSGFASPFDSLRAAAIGTSLFALAAMAQEYGMRHPKVSLRVKKQDHWNILILEFRPTLLGKPARTLRVLGPWPGDCERGSVERGGGSLQVYACSGVVQRGKVF